MLIGLGKQTKKVAQATSYTVSFSIYDSSLSATQTGDAPNNLTKFAGDTFIIPDQGNIVRTEISYQFPPGGGDIQQIPTNITLYGWSDGNNVYLPGDTYTMPNSDVTLSAIWNTIYAGSISSVSTNTASVGTVIDFYGIAIGTTNGVKFNRNKYATFKVFSDYHVQATVPAGARSGNVFFYGTNSQATYFGFTVV